MAEQETNVTASAEDSSAVPDPSPPDSLNGEIVATDGQEVQTQVQHPTPEKTPEAEAATSATVPVPETGNIPPPSTEESALDLEVRSALEREQELKKEHADREQSEVEPETEPKPQTDVLTPAEETVPTQTDPESGPVETVPPIAECSPPTTDALLEETLVTQPTVPDPVSSELEAKSEPEPASRPQVVGKTYHPAAEPTLRSPGAGAPAALPTPRAERPPFNPSADSKIAQELQEMQEREEELRRMRESHLRQPVGEETPPNPPPPQPQPQQSEPQQPESPQPQLQPQELPEEKRNGHSDHNAAPPAYNLGYAFGRRKDGVKVKPLSDDGHTNGQTEGEELDPVSNDAPDESLTFPVLKESPIEKEIREARERELELRKEKGGDLQQVQDSQNKRPSSLQLNGGGPWRGVSNGGVVKAVKDTQRFLATNRIQQEIVEQTEREMALRASGKIQTISQERTDAKVTRLRDVTSPAEKRALLLSSSPPPSPALSSSASDKSESGTTPGNGTTNGHHPKTPSPASSNSGGQVNQSPTANGRRFSNPPQVRGVSMQRFIASKGRELAFSAFGSKGQKSNSLISLQTEKPREVPARAPAPIVLSPSTNGTPPTNAKRCVPAETKIQVELKEMQAREDELRQQRARLLGLSQPNLSSLSSDDDLQVTNGHHHSKREAPDGMDRAASNPNLLDEEQYDEDNEKISVGGPRRRSMLIDQWEKRIQKAEDVKAT